jgi:hydroxyacylglutathione hydrolase
VVFTHGHWDHVLGWRTFPAAAVHANPTLAAAVAGGHASLDDALDFDGRWYVARPEPLAWPPSVLPVAEGQALALGRAELRALLLPGHSPDGLALVADGVLLSGDHLSPLEIPFVDDVQAYRATLARLLGVLPGLREVIPGHGPRLASSEAAAIARADLAYLDALARAAERQDEAGAAAIVLPRAAAVPGMRDHHRDNWQAALRTCRR